MSEDMMRPDDDYVPVEQTEEPVKELKRYVVEHISPGVLRNTSVEGYKPISTQSEAKVEEIKPVPETKSVKLEVKEHDRFGSAHEKAMNDRDSQGLKTSANTRQEGT